MERRWTIRALIVIGAILILFYAIRETAERRRGAGNVARQERQFLRDSAAEADELRNGRGLHAPDAPETQAQNVARRLSEFGSQRRVLTYQLAAKYGIEIDPEVAEFYAAVEAGDWNKMTNKFDSVWKRKDSGDPSAEGLRKLAAPMLETFGAAEQAHDWPPEKLLEYGHAILDALKPGMIYIGGTDAGRFIPTLLNDTEPDAERHIVITQNGLADRSYADYFAFQYGDQIAGLEQSDSDTAFQSYIDDARKRFEHDRDFPDEPKQVRKGEDIKISDGRIQVSGQVAVMDINERLLNRFIAKNPNRSFAMEESFPLDSAYAKAAPLGPIFEINSPQGAEALTADGVTEALNYWRKTAPALAADSELTLDALKTYSHMANAQGNLFGNREYAAQSEEAYRIALQLWPGNTEAVNALYALYEKNGRHNEAAQLLAEANARNPPAPAPNNNFTVEKSLPKK
jgi:tetratricopeptide (TPR) repeat protein